LLAALVDAMTSNGAQTGAVMGRLFARTSFLPSLAYNLLLERLSARTWYNAIDQKVVLGALPFRSMTTELVEQVGVRSVISMNEDYELRPFSPCAETWRRSGVRFLQLATTDIFEAPTQAKLRRGVAFIREEREGCVYVHCKAGRTRSACLVACYLMQEYGMSPEEAVADIASKRPHVWLGEAQWRAIREFASGLRTATDASSS